MKKTFIHSLRFMLAVVFVTVIASLTLSAAELPEKFAEATEVPEGYIGIYSVEDFDITDMTGKYILMNNISFQNESPLTII